MTTNATTLLAADLVHVATGMNECRDILLPTQWGLTKREYFAALAMQGWLANKDRPQHFRPKDDMEYRVKIADCLVSDSGKAAKETNYSKPRRSRLSSLLANAERVAADSQATLVRGQPCPT